MSRDFLDDDLVAVEKLVKRSLVTILRHLAPNVGHELAEQTEEASDPTVRAEDTFVWKRP